MGRAGRGQKITSGVFAPRLSSPNLPAHLSVSDIPLDLDSYEPQMQAEIENVVAELIKIGPIDRGQEPEINFKMREPLRKLPPLTVKIVGICGRPQSGKDVFADWMITNYQGVERMNFSDPIIEEVNQWLQKSGRKITPGNKSHPLHRKLLQLWGRGRRLENENYWTDSLRKKIAASKASLVIVAGVRAPSDLALIREMGGDCLRISRPGNPYSAEDPIERALDDYRIDEIINPFENDLGPYTDNIEKSLQAGLFKK